MADLRENDIRERAYQHYVNRGRKDGFAMQDWLTAERELREGRFSELLGARKT
jgi:hypothetical protein